MIAAGNIIDIRHTPELARGDHQGFVEERLARLVTRHRR